MKFWINKVTADSIKQAIICDVKTEDISGSIYWEKGVVDARVNTCYNNVKTGKAKKELIRLFELAKSNAPEGHFGVVEGEYNG